MMLNKELLQGELPADASSTVSVIITFKFLSMPCYRSSQEYQRHKERRKEK